MRVLSGRPNSHENQSACDTSLQILFLGIKLSVFSWSRSGERISRFKSFIQMPPASGHGLLCQLDVASGCLLNDNFFLHFFVLGAIVSKALTSSARELFTIDGCLSKLSIIHFSCPSSIVKNVQVSSRSLFRWSFCSWQESVHVPTLMGPKMSILPSKYSKTCQEYKNNYPYTSFIFTLDTFQIPFQTFFSDVLSGICIQFCRPFLYIGVESKC